MKIDIDHWQDRFNEFNLRERMLIVVVSLAFSYFVFDSILMMSLHEKQKLYQSEISKWSKQNQQVSQQIELMTAQLKANGRPLVGSNVGVLQAQVSDTEKQLETIIVKFVKPQQIATVLRNILKKEKGLRLMHMKSIAAVELFAHDTDVSSDDLNMRQRQVAKLLQFYKDREKFGLESEFDKSRAFLEKQQAKESIAKAGIPKIYKHGIVLELVGDYTSTLRYLKSLESLPWKFYWDAVRYEVLEYPKAKISILINTISLDEEWVRV